MKLETKIGTYRWIENWVTIPESKLSATKGRTHGIDVTRDGNLLVFHQSDPAVLIYDAAGKLLDRWGHFPGAHALTRVEENGTEYLWLVDQETREVVKTTLFGEEIQRIDRPIHPEYEQKQYIPTWVAVNEVRFGGNGDIWVADGYGASLVHRYDVSGKLLETLDGTTGAGRFKCPHGIWFDFRKQPGRLWVADRGNCRAQIFDATGRFERVFGDDFMTSPCGFAQFEDKVLVPELKARLTILDADDQLLQILGHHDEVSEQEGWPNRREYLEPGKCNSPHDACADAHGNLYLAEWIIGGRVTKLVRES